MTVRTPGSEGLTAPEPDAPDELPVVEQAVAEEVVKAPARRGRYAGVSDEERAEIESAIAELWREYKASGEERLRERLILHYSPLVKYVAGRVGVGLPPNIE